MLAASHQLFRLTSPRRTGALKSLNLALKRQVINTAQSGMFVCLRNDVWASDDSSYQRCVRRHVDDAPAANQAVQFSKYILHRVARVALHNLDYNDDLIFK